MTRKLEAFLFTLLLGTGAFAFAQTTASAPSAAAPTKIGVIDIQTAILATNEGQRDFGALQTKFQPKKAELETMSKEIEGLQKQLDSTGDKLNEQARADLVRQIDTKKKTAQRAYEDANSDFDSQKNEILQRLGNKVYATLDKYAKENNYAVIVDVSSQQSPVLWAAQATNITKPIVDAYNATSGVPAPARPAASSLPSAPAPGARTATTPHR
jgi:Skp family chaperone for outer membrane proteins